MRMFRAFAVLASLLICAPAFAQWQTPNHSIPIGRGSGVTGFGNVAPGAAGQPLISQGASSDPAFGTIANSGLTPGAADTYKGTLNGASVADVPISPCTAVTQALRYTAGVGFSCGNISITTGYDMPINLGLSVPAPSGNNLVINLTQANGSAPTSNNPVLVPFRSTATPTGTVTWATISAAQSITIPNGATLGTSNGVPFRIWIFEDYHGGTPELGVATCSNPTTIFPCAAWEHTLTTSTTIGAGSTSGGVLYSTAGVVADSVRIIGFCEFPNGLATAGAWASSCATVQPFGPGVKKPGGVVQSVFFSTTATTTTTNGSGSKAATSLTSSIGPSSAINLIRISTTGLLGNGGGGAASFGTGQIGRNSASTLIGQLIAVGDGASAFGTTCACGTFYDAPGVPTASTYTLYIWNSASVTTYWLPTTFAGGLTFPTNTGTMLLEEIMG